MTAHPSNARGLVHLAGHVGALSLTGALVLAARGTFWLLPAMLVHGVVLSFLFAPLHEAVHRTAFRSRRLNDAVAFACGLPLLLPPDWFRAFHFAHHRHTQIEGLDPELDAKRVETWRDYLVHLSGWRFWTAAVGLLVSNARGHVAGRFVPGRLKPRLVAQARLMLAIYAAIALLSVVTGSALALLLWVVPALLGQPFLRAYLLAEHTGLPLVEEMWENTRTTLTLAPVRWLAWNMPFHAEHHAHPGVPFHALRDLHRRERGRPKAVSPGYAAFHRDWQRKLPRRAGKGGRLTARA